MRKLKKIFWFVKALLANMWYGFPAKKLFMIGVTGTDGKTTTTTIIYHILKFAKEKTAYITTVGAEIGGQKSDLGFHVTTPRFFTLQRMLRQAVRHKAKYVVLEVTSHAIYQLRIWGIHFNIAVLTNITPEHLDYHHTYDEYAKVKTAFVNKADIIVVNKEAKTYYRYKHLLKNNNIWSVALNKKANLNFKDLKKLGLKDRFAEFEKENILLAFMVCRILGLKDKLIVQAINTFDRVKGRFDFFVRDDYSFLVDFAHTPYAMQKIFEALETQKSNKSIIHIFGCAGLRDKSKRDKMGQISARYAKTIILTEEDCRTEKINSIFAQIEKGIKKAEQHKLGKNLFLVPNRQEAINLAVKLANKNSLILSTGKGVEKSLARGKKEYAWNEYQAIETAIKSQNNSN